jgi:hypothetical protein
LTSKFSMTFGKSKPPTNATSPQRPSPVRAGRSDRLKAVSTISAAASSAAPNMTYRAGISARTSVYPAP